MSVLTKGRDLPTTIIAKLKTNPPGRVLDAGCGQGVIAKTLFRDGFESHACDIDKERFLPCPEGIDFQLVDLNGKLPYPDDYFDYICCTEVIEHVDNPFA